MEGVLTFLCENVVFVDVEVVVDDNVLLYKWEVLFLLFKVVAYCIFIVDIL
jgi:hypothetical protein